MISPTLQRIAGYALCSVLPIATLCVLVHEVGALAAIKGIGGLALIMAVILSLPIGCEMIDRSRR